MRFYVVLLLGFLALGKCVAADPVIGESFARIVSFLHGWSPPTITPRTLQGMQAGYEEALSYYANYTYKETPVFNTTSGPIQGAIFNESYAFYSIPFADRPQRFQEPVPLSSPLPLINATKANILVCEQIQRNCSIGICTQNTDEDCLLLNIHVPLGVKITADGATTSVRPVLVWIFGGAFFMGGGTIPQFEARYFAEKSDAVIVTVNYRLGAYGFLVHGNGTNAIKGNFGFKDQQLALKWVHDNIKTFGGNPEMVTIFGESAGAQSVMFHLMSNVSKSYFKRAIMESNPAVFPYQTLDEAKQVSARLVEALNCTGTVEEEQKCLMESDAKDINSKLPIVMASSLTKDHDLYSTIEPFRPVLDGGEFTTQPLQVFHDGNWNSDKDILMGTNANELEVIQFFLPKHIPFTEQEFRALNTFIFGNVTGDIVSDRYEQDYGNVTHPDYKVILGIEATHMFFICPSRLLARFATSTSKTGRVYLYNNAQPMNGTNCKEVIEPAGMCGYAFHASDPTLVFRSGPFFGYEFKDSDTMASNQFEGYWTNFALTGDPSNEGSINGVGHSLGSFQIWPAYNGTQDNATSWQNIIIDGDNDPGNKVDEAYMEDICNFWDSLNYYYDFTPTTTPGSASSKQMSFALYLLSILILSKFMIN